MSEDNKYFPIIAMKILNQLESLGDKKNEKLVVLEQNKGNEALKRFFQIAYDRLTTYGITVPPYDSNKVSIGITSPFSDDPTYVWKSFEGLLIAFANRTLTGSAAKEAWANFWSMLGTEERKWYSRALNRDLRVKIGMSLFLTIWPKLVDDFACQLAQTYEPGKDLNKPSKKEPWRTMPVWGEPKLDGVRIVIRVVDGVAHAYSREGRPQPLLESVMALINSPLIKASNSLPSAFSIDTEIMADAWGDTLTNLRSGVDQTTKLKFHCFDIDLGDNTSLFFRKQILAMVVEQYLPMQFSLVPHVVISDQKDIAGVYGNYVEQGYEGIMLKYPEAPYIRKRTNAWLKYKPVITMDGEIVGAFAGEPGSKYAKALGGFRVKTADGREFNVGSGFSDLERDQYWDDRAASFIGRIIEFESQDDKTAVAVARNPVFVRFRDDRESLSEE